jgi:putative Holliday junction resolvase
MRNSCSFYQWGREKTTIPPSSTIEVGTALAPLHSKHNFIVCRAKSVVDSGTALLLGCEERDIKMTIHFFFTMLWTFLALLFVVPPSNGFVVSLGHKSYSHKVQTPSSLEATLQQISPMLMTARGTIGIDTSMPPNETTTDDRCGTPSINITTSTNTLPSRSLEEAIRDAAAEFTQESCPLLGVKSLGVDYGLVRTGIAVTVGYNPTPLQILVESNVTRVAEMVAQIAYRERSDQIIVGLPLHKNGTEAEQTSLTRAFAAELATTVLKELGPDVRVLLFDERYTSKEAAARAHSKNPNQDLHGALDAAAACIILENYYDDNGRGMELVTIRDPSLVALYHAEWEERQRRMVKQLQDAMSDRDARLQWRREAMERDRHLEASSRIQGDGADIRTNTTARKRKKRQRK